MSAILTEYNASTGRSSVVSGKFLFLSSSPHALFHAYFSFFISLRVYIY